MKSCIRATALAASMMLAASALAVEPGQWTYQANLNLWGTSLSGDVGVRGLPTADVDISFSDIVENLDGALMGSLLATNGQWVVLTDLVWAKLSDKVDVGPFGGNVKFDQQMVIAQAMVGHVLPFDVRGLQLSAIGGLRYNYLDTELKISPASFPGIERDKSKDWVDPVIGLFMHYDINQRWYVNALADIGGFGVGSDFAAQGFLTVGYNWTDRFSTALGYRVLYTDYEKGGFVYDVTEHGPFLGLGYRF